MRLVTSHRRDAATAIGMLAVALIGVLLARDQFAGAAPANAPQIVIAESCVPLGGRISVVGSGFAAGEHVTIMMLTGRYTGPTTPGGTIGSKTVKSDSSGGFATYLRAFTMLPSRRAMVPVAIAAGTAKVPGGSLAAFDQTVVATRKLCAYAARR